MSVYKIPVEFWGHKHPGGDVEIVYNHDYKTWWYVNPDNDIVYTNLPYFQWIRKQFGFINNLSNLKHKPRILLDSNGKPIRILWEIIETKQVDSLLHPYVTRVVDLDKEIWQTDNALIKNRGSDFD
jgi:hypothetical protein